MLYYEAGALLLTLENRHYTVEAISLNTVTDFTDDLVTVSSSALFGGNSASLKGNVFFLKNHHSGQAKIIVTYSADFEVPSILIRGCEVKLSTGGFEVEILDAQNKKCEEVLRAHLRKFQQKRLIAMSNTWGDCNGRTRVNRAFVINEIISAGKIGLDAAQIDDGWQSGDTADRSIFDRRGLRHFENGFWELNLERFENGLEEIYNVAKENNVTPGLWFAPDFHDNFKHYERDISVLKNAHKKWGMDYIKLDMLYIDNTPDKEKFISMLEELKKLAVLELDVTYGLRLGYINSLKYGIIFVENRYTKTATYMPYRTLKNLWELSKYVPSSTLQIELVNPDLNTGSYPDDPFAPKEYDMDYLFAVTMVANPLFWMETQFLSVERLNELNRLFPLWKELRDDFINADVKPVLDSPSGTSFTGFLINGSNRYALIFREKTENDSLDIDLGNATVLQSNGNVVYNNGTLTFSKKNCYALLKLL